MITFSDIRLNHNILNDVDGVEGIYKVYLPHNIKFSLKRGTTAITNYKGRSLVYESDEDINHIINRWNNIQKCREKDNSLLYIGRSNNIKRRLKEFAAYGVGKSKCHRGGRILWQLESAMLFEIDYFPCKNAKEEEYRLINDFKIRHDGNRPIANEID